MFDPKAFMLYRQHHQSSVVAQNPGMTNPEISKVIGRQWRAESQEVKDGWDALAEVGIAYVHDDVWVDEHAHSQDRKKNSGISNNIRIISINHVERENDWIWRARRHSFWTIGVANVVAVV